MTIASDLAADLAAVLQRWEIREDEMVAWLTGNPTGGPNGDGRYPLTAVDGTVYLIQCPALLEDTLSGPAAQAQDSATAAAQAKTESESARDAAVQAQAGAEDALRLASLRRDEAANSEANIRTMVKRHFPQTDTLRVPNKTLSLPNDDPQGIIRWDDNYVYLNTTNGWKRIALESF